MKLIRFLANDKEYFGSLNEDFSIDVFANFDDYFACRNAQKSEFRLENVKLLSPLLAPQQDVICLGINYLEHAKESYEFKGKDFDGKRDEAVYFSKRVNEFSAPECKVELFTNSLDYECELAFVTKKDAYKLDENANFDDFILGYTILNDISDRAIQNKHKQWYFGKSLSNSCPFGPFINTDLCIKDASNLDIKCFVNGELRQNSNTNLLIFDIPYILKEISHYTCIKAGSVISTGTPSGVGMGFKPPKFLKSGDEIRCEIAQLGTLKTYIG